MYLEPAREIPIRNKVNVIVIGSGPAGIAASISAARQGASTLLLEMGGMVGGISTSGMMSHFTGRADSLFYHEVLRKMSLMNSESHEITVQIDTEKLRELYMNMLMEAGVTYRLFSTAAGVIKEGNRLKGVIVQSRTVREAFEADVIIDATGDGDVAALSGVPFTKGRESDGSMQPMTTMFKIAGVDYDRAVFPGSFETHVQTEKGELQSLASQLLPKPAGHVLLYRNPIRGIVTVNMTNCINVDGTNAEDLTRAETVCHSQILPIINFLREYVPGYEKCYLIASAAMVGIRETRHLEGVYCLTEQDILERRVFDDWIVRGAEFNFDIHNLTGSGLDPTGSQAAFPKDTKYTIPYRSLLPKEVDGLLFAGRCLSATHVAFSNCRAMPICMAMGEAAGIAAALASRYKITPRKVNVKEIQALL